ncbi:Transcriptional regulator, contains XRE-family HTH domain [Curtobacterium sp. 9128]|nr:Transcriptional regulator, contains XRE-family HTH domain [Curtobacterium sp. 9128]
MQGAYAKKGLSRQDIADRTGISKSTIDRYMQAKLALPQDKFVRIAEAIGAPPAKLLQEAVDDATLMLHDAAVSEAEGDNVARLHPRQMSAEELDRLTIDHAATGIDPESETDETD